MGKASPKAFVKPASDTSGQRAAPTTTAQKRPQRQKLSTRLKPPQSPGGEGLSISQSPGPWMPEAYPLSSLEKPSQHTGIPPSCSKTQRLTHYTEPRHWLTWTCHSKHTTRMPQGHSSLCQNWHQGAQLCPSTPIRQFHFML
ncbi:Hypothetical predicted protein [Pelobates cultripes]|uniref:Uncharacterized protein n=1 Tax=Pelobates cultripes TaxID=61616 RepID=A0AAD1WTM1_PELCU|nr:Hypothetical predicted protein [Pelobates cultripes]